MWKIRCDHEIKECKSVFFSVCFYYMNCLESNFSTFGGIWKVGSKGTTWSKPSKLARAPWERRDRDAFVPWPWKLGQSFVSFFHWNKELHWQICLVKVMLLMVSNIFYFHPYLRKWSNFDSYFSNGLKPPTRWCLYISGMANHDFFW